MINPKELRIGNWIASGGFRRQIRGITEGSAYLSPNPNSSLDFNSFEFLHPIPLTHELLLKIGADYDDHRPFDEFYDFESYYFECSKLTNVAIHYSHNNKKFYYPKYEIAPIEYLHQLQNLFFALTGEELKIKL